MEPSKRPRFRWSPAATGLAVTAACAAVLLAGMAGGDGSAPAAYVPAFSVLAGALAAAFQAKRLKATLGGLLFGLLVGALSALTFIGQQVEGRFFMVAATLTFYAVLLLSAGAFLEFVLFLHRLTHGARPRGREKEEDGRLS